MDVRNLNAEQLKKAAEQGDAEAQYELGVRYAFGRGGIRSDDEKMAEWFKKALDQWTELAEQGDAKALFKLGMCYGVNGRAAKENWHKSYQLYMKSAELGYPWAQSYLAWCHADGYYNASLDKKKSKELYKKAAEGFIRIAEQGDADAQYEAGSSYAGGLGVAENREKAVEWYMKAAEQGQPEACQEMRKIEWIVQSRIKNWENENDIKTAQNYGKKISSFQYCPNSKKFAQRLLPFIECKPLVDVVSDTVKDYEFDVGIFGYHFYFDLIGYYYSLNLLVLYVANERKDWERTLEVLDHEADKEIKSCKKGGTNSVMLRILKYFEKDTNVLNGLINKLTEAGSFDAEKGEYALATEENDSETRENIPETKENAIETTENIHAARENDPGLMWEFDAEKGEYVLTAQEKIRFGEVVCTRFPVLATEENDSEIRENIPETMVWRFDAEKGEYVLATQENASETRENVPEAKGNTSETREDVPEARESTPETRENDPELMEFDAGFEPEILEITVLTSSHSFFRKRDGKDRYFESFIYLKAIRLPGAEKICKPKFGYLVIKGENDYLTEMESKILPYTIYVLKVRKRNPYSKENGAYMGEVFTPIEIVESNATGDKELEKIAEKQRQIVIYHDPTLGDFELEREYRKEYEGKVKWNNEDVPFHVTNYKGKRLDSVFAIANEFVKDQVEWDKKIREFACRKFLSVKYKYLHINDDDKKLTPEAFISRIKVTCIFIKLANNFQVTFDDDGIFFGLAMNVYGNLEKGPTREEFA